MISPAAARATRVFRPCSPVPVAQTPWRVSASSRRVSAAFLDFVRARPTGTPSALRPSLDRALELIAFELTAAGIRTAVDVPDSLPAIALDGATLDQILVSMVLDAIDVARASGGGGTIAITAGTNDDGAVRIATAERVLTLPTAAAPDSWKDRGQSRG